jgi:hypothetical protein
MLKGSFNQLLARTLIVLRFIPPRLGEGVAAQCFSSSYRNLPLVRRPSTADIVALARHEARVV